jgi:hypothetical protein
MIQLMYVSSKTVLDTWFSDYFKLPIVAGPTGLGVGQDRLLKDL